MSGKSDIIDIPGEVRHETDAASADIIKSVLRQAHRYLYMDPGPDLIGRFSGACADLDMAMTEDDREAITESATDVMALALAAALFAKADPPVEG